MGLPLLSSVPLQSRVRTVRTANALPTSRATVARAAPAGSHGARLRGGPGLLARSVAAAAGVGSMGALASGCWAACLSAAASDAALGRRSGSSARHASSNASSPELTVAKSLGG
ncbi:hypothetical protein, partial [Hyalangium gracile]|uniref:hypothetical protein n=1 Tax=Hyalangium gracile TaxID=394092 RepID=UPI001CCE89C3